MKHCDTSENKANSIIWQLVEITAIELFFRKKYFLVLIWGKLPEARDQLKLKTTHHQQQQQQHQAAAPQAAKALA